MRLLLILALIFQPQALGGKAGVGGKAGIGGGPSGGGEVTLDTDAFTGTAATQLPTYNANWVNGGGSCCNNAVISTPNGGVASGGSVAADFRTGFTWTNDQFSQATFVAIPSSLAFICVRYTVSAGNPASGYCAGVSPGHFGSNVYTLYDIVSGMPLTTSATTWTANDVLNLNVVGNNITVKLNGAVLADLNTTSSLYSTGDPGIYMNNSSATAKIISTWSAGSN